MTLSVDADVVESSWTLPAFNYKGEPVGTLSGSGPVGPGLFAHLSWQTKVNYTKNTWGMYSHALVVPILNGPQGFHFKLKSRDIQRLKKGKVLVA